MAAKTLAKRLMDIQAELLALKTAHRRGLGVINFYSANAKSEGYSGVYLYNYLYVRIRFAEGEPLPGFAQVAIICGRTDSNKNLKGWLVNAEHDEGGRVLTYEYAYGVIPPGALYSFDVKVVSVSKIESLELEVIRA